MIVVRGGGDLASGVVYRLHRAGFAVAVLELPEPLFVRRPVSYGEAVYSGTLTVEGVTARLTDVENIAVVLGEDTIAVLVDPIGEALERLKPLAVIDARMEKRNLGTTLQDAPLVVGLGPGFTAGLDCHAVIETNRGHDLGRVIAHGPAEADTGEPGSVQNQTHSRVLRASAEGYVRPLAAIGDTIESGTSIAEIGGQPVIAAFRGVLRGLIHERVRVSAGMKIGDLDPRAERENCFSISDKSLAIGGAAVEAVLSSPAVRARLRLRHETPRGA